MFRVSFVPVLVYVFHFLSSKQGAVTSLTRKNDKNNQCFPLLHNAGLTY